MKQKILFLVLIFFMYPLLVMAEQIHDAARDGDLDKVIELAIENPQSLYSFCDMGKTPLHWASGKGQLEVVKVLLNRFKVPVDIQNANQGTPLHVAASQAQYGSAVILIDHGANIDAKAKDGATPLHYASFKGTRDGHIKCIQLLLEKGCQVNPTMDNGATPLNMALARGNSKAIELLKKSGGKQGVVKKLNQSGKYDFRGGVAGKRINENQENETSKSTDQFQDRKKMMLKNFDANNDGVLDAAERQKAREVLQKHRMKNY